MPWACFRNWPIPLQEKEELDSARSALAKLLIRVREYFQPPLTLAAGGLATAMIMTTVFFVNALWLAAAPDEYATAIGGRQSYTLEDGTVVALNTNTRIQVDYSNARRAITLVQGEASFDVAKNPERPFVVYAGTGLVWAVGTVFNIRYDAGQVDVLVTEGRVKVFSDARATDPASPSLKDATPATGNTVGTTTTEVVQKQREALLGAGESLRYRQVIESLKTIELEERSRILAWHSGSLVFKGETLEQAIAEISRYTDKELVIADADLKQLRVGGHYKTDDIDSLLTSLGRGLDISVDYAADDRVLLSASTGYKHLK